MSNDELRQAKERIRQLEESMISQQFFIPSNPDLSLKEDEWWAIFSDFKDLTSGAITKIPWQGGFNQTSTFKVKKFHSIEAYKYQLEIELAKLSEDILNMELNEESLKKRTQEIISNVFKL